MDKHIQRYKEHLLLALNSDAMARVQELAGALQSAWENGRNVYICGNGGSAANAIHLANDFIYGAGLCAGRGLRIEALSANPAIITCLANDLNYDEVFAQQLRVKAQAGDVLLVLSGSGNSPNVVKALEVGNEQGLKTFAILGFTGGRCKALAHVPLHFAIDDMQIAEDLQLIVGHMCMQWLNTVLERTVPEADPGRVSA